MAKELEDATIIPNRKKYDLNITNGIATLRYPNRGFIDNPQILRLLAYSLQHTAKILEAGQLTSNELRYNSACNGADNITFSNNTKWYFGDEVDKELLNPTVGYVYFAQNSVDFPTTLKIGASNSPLERMRSLAAFYNVPNENFKVVALARTSHYEDLEYYLKIRFYKNKRVGEFFEEDALQWYLTYIQNYFKSDTLMVSNLSYNWSK